MAQSPNAMQEPSMDELLASIREIIEENTGPSPNRNLNRQETTAPAVSVQRDNTSDNQTRANQNHLSPDPMARMSVGDERSSRLNVQQYGDVSPSNAEAPPVQDAMNALAARIGLRHSEDSDSPMEANAVHDERQHVAPPPAVMMVKTPSPERASQVPNPSAIPQSRVVNGASHGGNINQPPVQGNALQSSVNKPMVAGQPRPQNTPDQAVKFQGQPLQQRNAQALNPSANQAIPPQHSAPQAAMEAMRAREMPQARPAPQQRDIGQPNDAAMRNQQMQANAASQPNTNRPMPPQPRTVNADTRLNAAPPQSSVRQNPLAERRVPIQQPNFNAEPQASERHEARINPQQFPVDPQVPNELNPNQRPANVSMHRPNVDVAQSERQVVDNQQMQNLVAPEAQAEPREADNSARSAHNNVPFPRSAPQKPHFLSQALRSAFMSIPAKDTAFQTASSLPQAPLRPQSVSTRSTPQTRVEQKATEMIEAEVKREMDNMDKALDADFERSAENLLRPYIAKWLDEHFSDLFEKVLREEIKRVIQAQLR
ncbi:DUF2497 domain-containing protein [Bartonella sp. HY329]|uniref:DUF2497 domain-containing protein n=1 Tax=unclassified Bartonella TaxID=2645622 RepID=UPI0021C5CB61|nr:MULTISPECIES: DUF2497 domain-containing protein [unclassified Bartonella]UXM94177.1 DUF2497 domain-containing protein [Bartonella sp. HY329]UXN08499.1 DUF2497 domain-containing protein [Bartonella sp. HY328]